MGKVAYYTVEGMAKLRAEISHLEKIERPKISEQIGEARDKGDLSENAEYDAAKEAQGLLEMKISKLKNLLSNARLVDESQLDTTKALILSIVTIENTANGMKMTYTLVAENEQDLKAKKISVESPIGQGLLGKSVGDIAEIKIPAGLMTFKILDISRNA
ncbi:MAG: transcription elongation factor GreA [Flavobacteriales bacterium]|jgi:transcription elongation factor GreA